MLTTSDFDFDLPTDLIASHPLSQRDESRMLVVEEEKISDNAITEQNSSRQRYFPPELEAIFSRMRNSILTNDKKI